MVNIPFEGQNYTDDVIEKIEGVINSLQEFRAAKLISTSAKKMLDNLNNIQQVHNFSSGFLLDYIYESQHEKTETTKQDIIEDITDLKSYSMSKSNRTNIKNSILKDKNKLYTDMSNYIKKNKEKYSPDDICALNMMLADLKNAPNAPIYKDEYQAAFLKMNISTSYNAHEDMTYGMPAVEYFSTFLDIIDDQNNETLNNIIKEVSNDQISSGETKNSLDFSNFTTNKTKQTPRQSQAEILANEILLFSEIITKKIKKTAFESINELPSFDVMFDTKAYIMEPDESQAKASIALLKYDYDEVSKLWDKASTQTKNETKEIIKQKYQKINDLLPALSNSAKNLENTIKLYGEKPISIDKIIQDDFNVEDIFKTTDITINELSTNKSQQKNLDLIKNRAIFIKFERNFIKE